MTVWEALEFLDTLVDDSDPDVDFTQIEHALQTAESIRRANQPRWFIVTGLIHDLGKILCLFGEPQWAVVGDTFPVGCQFSTACVYPEFFARIRTARIRCIRPGWDLRTELRPRQRPSCRGATTSTSITSSRTICRPKRSTRCATTRSIHGTRKASTSYLANDQDREMLKWVSAFNRYNLYSKGDGRPDAKALRPYYEDLVNEFFPTPLQW